MKLTFTKMQGAGNDFVVLDATRAPLSLSSEQMRALADRRFGIGADQILVVGPPDTDGVDFSYRIFNQDGGEVQQCGNGARAFVRFVREKGLTDKTSIRVSTLSGVIAPRIGLSGEICVDMGAPQLEARSVPFHTEGLVARQDHALSVWSLDVGVRTVEIGVCSMGNPHAVTLVGDIDTAPVAELGAVIEVHRRFPERVNVGFLRVRSRHEVDLRVWERGVGETLACGTGACAAVVCAIERGLVDSPVDVHARGGELTVRWNGPGHGVELCGPAVTVFEGVIDLQALVPSPARRLPK